MRILLIIVLLPKDDTLIFTEDTIFNSISAASNRVLGRNSNGYMEWIDEKGRTFKDVQDTLNLNR